MNGLYEGNEECFKTEGAFSLIGGSTGGVGNAGGPGGGGRISFAASDSSSIYGAETVSPASAKFLTCIKF